MMDPKHARPGNFGSLHFVPGQQVVIVEPFASGPNSDFKPGQKFVYLGYSYFAYDEGTTIYLMDANGSETFLSFTGLEPEQAQTLDNLHRHLELR